MSIIFKKNLTRGFQRAAAALDGVGRREGLAALPMLFCYFFGGKKVNNKLNKKFIDNKITFNEIFFSRDKKFSFPLDPCLRKTKRSRGPFGLSLDLKGKTAAKNRCCFLF